MLDSIRYRSKRRRRRTDPASVSAAIVGHNPRVFDEKDMREWPATYMAFAQANGSGLTPFNQALVLLEVERRKAWDAPAAWSAVAAFLAFMVALTALAVALIRGPAPAAPAADTCPASRSAAL